MGSNHRAQWLWDMCDGHCAYCGVKFATVWEMTTDHLKPRKLGGDNSKANRFPCCASCNASKGSRTIEYLRDSRQRARTGRPQFSAQQRGWLADVGFEFPAEEPYVFYWEKMGNTFPVEAS